MQEWERGKVFEQRLTLDFEHAIIDDLKYGSSLRKNHDQPGSRVEHERNSAGQADRAPPCNPVSVGEQSRDHQLDQKKRRRRFAESINSSDKSDNEQQRGGEQQRPRPG